LEDNAGEDVGLVLATGVHCGSYTAVLARDSPPWFPAEDGPDGLIPLFRIFCRDRERLNDGALTALRNTTWH
jgi:hypothetical protein